MTTKTFYVSNAQVDINVDDGAVRVTGVMAAGTNLIGKVGIDQVTANANEVVLKSGTLTTLTNGAKDAGPQWTSVFGVSGAVVASADMTTAAHVTDAPTAGQKIVVTDIIVSVDTAMSVLFEDHTGADLIKVYMPANSTLQITPRSKMKLAVADDVLTAKASVAGNIAVTVFYYSEA